MANPMRRHFTNGLRLLWIIVITWFEYGIFLSYSRHCNWPDLVVTRPDLLSGTNYARPFHVLLVADPQILDLHSYPARGVVLSHLTRLVVDLNLRKNWKAALTKDPDAVVFLGDMMDNGRHDMSDEEYKRYYNRFKSIFRTRRDIPQYFIPGNHDVGLGTSLSSVSPYSRSRYTAHFGTSNRDISAANHTLVFFDAPGYADEDAKRHGQRKAFQSWVPIPGGALEYMNKFAHDVQSDPVILFSHIPLYRKDGKPCGPLREKGTLRPGVGPGYQNTLEKQSSQRLLEAFQPVAVFSGDDHDYCEFTHQLPLSSEAQKSIPEITVKTLSMVMNVRRPGFQLLSLTPASLRPKNRPSYADTPCFLPDQLHIYLGVYLPLFALSIFFVVAFNISRTIRGRYRKQSTTIQPLASLVSRQDAAGVESEEDAQLSPYYSNTISHSLPPPITTTNQNKYASRASRGSGWRLIADERQYGHEKESHIETFKVAVCSLCSNTVSYISSRSESRRRTWISASIRDIRDIAIFPIGTFILITWLVTR